jgi:hypothetical protein
MNIEAVIVGRRCGKTTRAIEWLLEDWEHRWMLTPEHCRKHFLRMLFEKLHTTELTPAPSYNDVAKRVVSSVVQLHGINHFMVLTTKTRSGSITSTSWVRL